MNAEDRVFLIPSEDPKEDESLQDIALHNLKVSDEHFDLAKFSVSATAWMKCHSECGFPELESFLRENNFNTYVFGRKPPPPTTTEDLKNPNHPDMQCDWMIYFSCRPPPYAKDEVLKECSSLEENRHRLATAGFATFSSDTKLPKSVKRFDTEEISDAEKISEGKKKLVVTKKSKSDIFEETLREVTALNGNRKPKTVVLNAANNLFGLQLDNGDLYPVVFDTAYNRYHLYTS